MHLLRSLATGGTLVIGLVAFPLEIYSAGTQVPLKFVAKSGHSYQIQWNPELNRFWQDMSLITNAGAVNLSMPATNGRMGFYQVLDAVGPTFWYGWTWQEQSPTLQVWGMGTNQITYCHNDRPYEWYIDQGNSGPDSADNCGPSATAMACNWYNSNTVVTAEAARNTYPESNGWWNITDVYNYLNLQGVSNSYVSASLYSMTNTLTQGDILILCLDMAYVSQATNLQMRTHAFYSGVTGHFIVVKGYRVTDSTVWFECYDPYNWGATYSDASPMGRDRHYSWNDLNPAITNWWPLFFAVPPPGSVHMNALSAPILDPAKVPVARGQ